MNLFHHELFKENVLHAITASLLYKSFFILSNNLALTGIGEMILFTFDDLNIDMHLSSEMLKPHP